MSVFNTTVRFDPSDPATAEFMKFLEECGLPHDVATSGALTSEQLEAAGINDYYVTSLAMRETGMDEILSNQTSLSPAEAAQANGIVSRVGAEGLKALLRDDACPGGMSGMSLWKNLTDVEWSHERHDVFTERKCSYATYAGFGFTPEDLVGLHYVESMMPEAGREIGASVVSVGCDGWDGSAVVVSPDGTILTAAHVLYDDPDETGARAFAENPYVEVGGIRYPFSSADVIASDTEADLAVVKIPGLAAANPAFAKIAVEAPAEASPVMVVGYPAMAHRDTYERLYTPGTFQSVGPGPDVNDRDEESFVRTDTKFHSGNSGGAVFNQRGELVGIVSTTVRGQDYSASVIPSTIRDPELQAALQAIIAGRAP